MVLSVVLASCLLVAACSGSEQVPESGDQPSAPATSAAGSSDSDGGSTQGSAASDPDETGIEPIRIGMLLDESNLMLATDRQPGIAFAAAIERINAAGGLLGRPVELIRENTTSRLSTVDRHAAEMVDAGVTLIVITCELDFARPAIERAEAADVLVISPCAPEPEWGTGEVGDLAFSMIPPPDVLGAAMADHLFAVGHAEVAVLADRTSPEASAECEGFVERWRDLGGAIGVDERLNLAEADTIATNTDLIEELDSPVIVLCAFWRLGEPIIEGLRANGITRPIVAGPALDSGQWIPEDVDGGLGEFSMLTFASTWGDDPEQSVLDSFADFLVEDGIQPSSGRFVLGSDLALLYELAVTEAGSTDAAAVAAQIRSLDGTAVGSGTLTFAGANAPTSRALRVMRFDGSGFVFDGLVGS